MESANRRLSDYRKQRGSPHEISHDSRWLKMSFFCLKATPNKLALNSERDHNHSMKRASRLSRLFGWSVRSASVVLALAFCASAFAADPSKNVVLPAQPQRVTKTAKKMCYTLTSTSGIPVPCDRLSAIPTTTSPMNIYRQATTQ